MTRSEVRVPHRPPSIYPHHECGVFVFFIVDLRIVVFNGSMTITNTMLEQRIDDIQRQLDELKRDVRMLRQDVELMRREFDAFRGYVNQQFDRAWEEVATKQDLENLYVRIEKLVLSR